MFLYLISMNDLTRQEREEAAQQGWGLFHVYDMEKSRWVMNVLPLEIGNGKDATAALNHVIAQAKFNHPLSIKALQLIAKFNAGKKK